MRKSEHIGWSHHLSDANVCSIWERQIVRWFFFLLAVVAIFPGPRTVYRVFDMANIVVALIVIIPRLQTLEIPLPKMMSKKSP